MCGIAGIVGEGAASMRPLVSTMAAALAHRGPDGEGFFSERGIALGHRRLAILDLRTSANQPMLSPCGRYVLIFNGEIYNYQELREQLSGDFRTTCDTEVLLAAWSEWGEDALPRLRGMFAFAVWDRLKKRCFLARDRFGIKPLFFALHDGHYFFASEIKALLAVGIPREPNVDTIAEYLLTGLYDNAARTFFRRVERLEAGTCAWIDDSGHMISRRRWYDLAAATQAPLDIEIREASELWLDTASEAVRIHRFSDVPLGFSLSGGVDSSALVSLSASMSGPIGNERTFSVVYADKDYSERPWVEAVCSRADRPCDFIVVDHSQAAAACNAMVAVQDEPFGGVPTGVWGPFFSHAHDAITVLLDGSGPDDFLAGYYTEAVTHLINRIDGKDPGAFRDEVADFAAFWGKSAQSVYDILRSAGAGSEALALDGTSPVQPTAVGRDLRTFAQPGRLQQALEKPSHRLRPRLIERILRTKIPRALRFKDRASMAASIELRVPFIDHVLIELSLRLPDDVLVQRGRGKFVMRRALESMLPERVLWAPKRSVQTPQREWTRRGPLAQQLEEALNRSNGILADILDLDEARRIFRLHREQGLENTNAFWQWLNLDLWYEHSVRNDAAYQRPHWPTVTIESFDPTSHRPEL